MTEEEAVDQYMHGYCMFMAAALHHKYGWPIGLMTIEHDKVRLSHAWVITPKGHLDIQGIQTLEQVTVWMNDSPECNYQIRLSVPLDLLEELAEVKLLATEPDVVLALATAQKYLGRELQTLGVETLS
jgi:hypothetical protein